MNCLSTVTAAGEADVSVIVDGLSTGIPAILGGNLIALYLTGSLTYGDFDAGSSDIDYLAIMEREITPEERAALATLHTDLGLRHPVWRERIEGSYITHDMLACTLPPPRGRPYVNQGAFWDPDPPYGNEWLINLYAIQETGTALCGPNPGDLIPPVRIEDVREASRRDLTDERIPELNDPGFLPDSHHEAYVTLTLCRILHREFNDGIASKRVASAWVRETYGEPWRSLVARAEAWQHGQELDSRDDVIAFTRFVASELGIEQADSSGMP